MNKQELINAMAVEAGMTKVDAKKALDAFMATVTKTLKNGEKVSLVGFGTFSVYDRMARIGVNPSTKGKIEIPAKRVTRFRAGVDLISVIEE